MQFTTAIAVLFSASVALAFRPCQGGLYSNPQCCDTDVLGVASLNCQPPKMSPNSAMDYQRICSAQGQIAKCCAVPVLGQGVLCKTPIGVKP